MAGLPTGTVTFLFTDVEGSTRLLQHLGDRYVDVLGAYRQLLRTAIEARNGHEVDTQGDAFFIAFPRAKDALAAALQAQRAIAAHQWPENADLRVRMGLHTGEPRTAEMGYVGLDVHRAARICAAGHGGQILLSQTTRDLIGHELPTGISLRDLGGHRLKDLAEAQHLFQVLAADLPADFPPLKSLDSLANNLPRQLSSFVGREKEMAEIKALLASTALLTVTGAGGCGKTRLALQVAADILDDYADGVWFVELAALTDPGLVLQTIASALGVREEPGRSLLMTLIDFTRPKVLLLVLDNCEHLLPACAQLTETLLRACPGLRVLATSRETLGVDGELVYRVPSLSVPDPKRIPSAGDLTQSEAVRLFAERAAHSRQGFVITKDNWRAVAEVCRRLDGLPLAIELAAARVNALSVEQIESRLKDRFQLLTGGSRARLPRQQTLRAVLDWSYHLLSNNEQTMFCRLSIFAGSWTLDTAEAACATAGIEPFEILDLVTQLVLKSLVLVEQHGTETRYRFLETVRQYGLEKLQGSGELDPMRRRHRDVFLAMAERAKPELRGTHQRMWLDRLDAEHDNLRAALEWCRQSGEADEGLRLAAALVRFWSIRGYFEEGRDRLAGGLSLVAETGPTVGRAEALDGAGLLAWRQGDHSAARGLYEESLSTWRALGDKSGIAQTLNHLGGIARQQGDYPAAIGLYRESLAARQESEDKLGIAYALNNLGLVARERGDYAQARALHEETLALEMALGDGLGTALALNNLGLVAAYQRNYEMARSYYEKSLDVCRDLRDKGGIISYALNNLGSVAYYQGQFAEARARITESLAIKRELGDKLGIAYALNTLGSVALRQGDVAEAGRLYEESLAIRRALGERLGVAECLEGLAGLAGVEGRAARSAQLFGAAEVLREAIGAPLPPCDRAGYDRNLSVARAGLHEDAFAAAWASGREMTLEQAVEYALTCKGL